MANRHTATLAASAFCLLLAWPHATSAFECNDGTDNDSDTFTDFDSDAPLDGDRQCHTFYDDDESPPLDSGAIKPRLLIIFDTSGSMAYTTCSGDHDTNGDGSAECPGDDVSCSSCTADGCGNGLADDSRMYKVKQGIADAVAAFGEIEWGLMRFKQDPDDFSCGHYGGWDGVGNCGDITPGTGGNAGEVLAAFGPDSTQSLLKWMDNVSNLGSDPDAGDDWELRAEGNTPLAGSLTSAGSYIAALRAQESADVSSCRPYAIVLVTDGQDNCQGDPVDVAEDLSEDPTSPILVYVIGFATNSSTIEDQLNDIANAGDGDDDTTTDAVLVSNPEDLSNAIATIAASVIHPEVACNLLDDDCDQKIDEGFPSEWTDEDGTSQLGPECTAGQGVCFAEGNMQCLDDTAPYEEFVCSVTAGTPTCPGGDACCAADSSDSGECCNGFDDDCDGKTDENTTNCNCSPVEFCNGEDDDCDGNTDEDPDGPLPGEGVSCLVGLDGIGICTAGITDCQGGELVCNGGQGPITETCDGRDENCNTVSDTDELDRSCYTGTATFDGGGNLIQGCDPNDSSNCLGNCQHGTQECVDTGGGVWGYGACAGQVVPGTETCNGADDDCDDDIDEDFTVGDACSVVTQNPGPGVAEDCTATGIYVCDSDGEQVCNAIPVPVTDEVCDGNDNDCDGTIDEDLPAPVGETCGSAGGGSGGCGTGTFVCDNGSLVCQFDGTATDEVCDGINNDCDASIDEEFPFMNSDCTDDPLAYDPPATDGDVGECQFGSLVCENGTLACDGYVGPTAEICDGLDNDCDGTADNMATCPNAGDLCLEGACAFPCAEDTEFRCPFGFVCKNVPDGMGGNGDFCLPDPCKEVTCDPGFVCESSTGDCTDLCVDVSCPDGAICNNGFCIDCFNYECDEGEVCVTNGAGVGVCEPDLCADVECGGDAFCQDGECHSLSCDPACDSDERCVDGECITDRCADRDCPEGSVCRSDTGKCTIDPCSDIACLTGEVCVPATKECVSDPCAQVQCPSGLSCAIDYDGRALCAAPKGDLIFPGGGGAGCSAADGPASGWTAVLLLGLFGFRRRPRRARRTPS